MALEDVTTQLLATLNQLNLKAFSCRSKKNLIFVALNDTVHLIKYDRATFWDLSSKEPTCLGISGQTTIDKNNALIHKMGKVAKKLPDPSKYQVVRLPKDKSVEGQVSTGKEIEESLWIPIPVKNKTLGLWLERVSPWQEEEIKLLFLLTKAYGLAWEKLTPRFSIHVPSKLWGTLLSAFLIGFFFFLPVPLRVVAPCEIVSQDPIYITAPLDGIIKQMLVKPGDIVKKDTPLFVYDKQVPLQEFRVAEKQVEIAQSQLNRTMTQGINDPKQLDESSVWQLQLEKEKIQLALAKERVDLLDVNSPANGVAIFDNPEEWRGKKVATGEKILVVSDPTKTKIRMWVPEADNVVIQKDKEVKIYLNIDPLVSYDAKLSYIADFSVITAKGVNSFSAEANWVDPPKEARLGLEGNAILYGDDVSIFYWLFRKPILKIREWLEI